MNLELELNDIYNTYPRHEDSKKDRMLLKMAHCYLLARDQASKNLQGRETILSYMFLKTKLHCIALIATFVTDNLFLTEWNPALKKGMSTLIA